MMQNFVEDPMSGRRRLVGLSELDVSRDVMDFKYITNSDQEAEPIEFFLEMKQWDESGIGIQVHYSNPLMVGKGNDNIITTLKNPGLFAPASGEEPPSKDQGTNFAAAPPQVPKGVDEEELKSDATTACTALVTIMIAMVVIQTYIGGNFRDFWGLFFVLQFMAYTHYYGTVLPGNAEIYLLKLQGIVDFSALNPDVVIRLFIEEWNIKKENLDKDAHISVYDDVKLYLLLIGLFIVGAVLMALFSLVKCLRGKSSDGLSVLKSKFVWDYTIQLFYVAYLKLCMTAMNQIDLKARNSYYWKALDADYAIGIGAFLIAFPLLSFMFLTCKSKELDEPQVKAKYQNLYSDAALYRSRWAKFYSIAFALRRIVFIAIPFMFDAPMLQVIVFILFHSLYLAAYINVNPHIDTKRTYIEIFNEFVLLVFMYHLAGWSGLIADLQMQFDVGYSFILVVLVTMCANTGLICYRTVENWRHRRAVELNRLLVLQQLEAMKSDSEDKSAGLAEKKLIRAEFIRNRLAQERVKKIETDMSSKYHARGDSRTPLADRQRMNTIKEEDSMELSNREMNVLELAV